MKLKYIFTALVAALTLAVGCEDDIETYLDEVRVSSSYVAIPAAGGSQTITVNAKSDWSFGDIPEWVKVSPTTGVAGETEVTFKAEATTATKEAMLYLTCDGKSQIINVLQQTKKVELEVTPLKEFLAAEVVLQFTALPEPLLTSRRSRRLTRTPLLQFRMMKAIQFTVIVSGLLPERR